MSNFISIFIHVVILVNEFCYTTGKHFEMSKSLALRVNKHLNHVSALIKDNYKSVNVVGYLWGIQCRGVFIFMSLSHLE